AERERDALGRRDRDADAGERARPDVAGERLERGPRDACGRERLVDRAEEALGVAAQVVVCDRREQPVAVADGGAAAGGRGGGREEQHRGAGSAGGAWSGRT